MCVLFVFLLPAPCFATEDDFFDTDALLTVNTYADLSVNAKAYALMDCNTGTLLAAKNENMQLYPASVTKIMTLLLVSEAIAAGKLSFDETLVCSDTAAAKGGSQIWLEPGEEMTVRDLLKAAAVYSANDACTLLGEAVAGSEETFVQMMNSRAAELGMENTHFDNCTGLDDDTTTHLTTAYDVALMSRALLNVDFIRDYTTIWMDTLRGGRTQLVNTNKLIRYYSGITGLKTGTTSKAGCCVSATAERDGLGLVAVVLGADSSNDRFNGARALLDYGFANYEIFTPSFDPSSVNPVKVNHGETCSVALQAALSGDILLSRGAGAKITQETEYAEETDAPVEKGQVLGALRFYAGDALVAQYDLTAAADVPKLSFLKAIFRIFRSLDRG
ncbi:MAG: D-alanyl-D-alanine carboxypeptidase [Clostridia bacterium]|nr:D-alanyl-D-alanine carboxypeptidase [Clostridia bacterium]